MAEAAPLGVLSSARASGCVSKDRPAGGKASLDTRLTPLLGMREVQRANGIGRVANRDEGKERRADGRGAAAIRTAARS